MDLLNTSPEQTGASCCGNCSPGTDKAAAKSDSTANTTATYGVTGMTCSHCVSSVTEELSELDGVAEVQVHLVPEGVSEVTISSTDPVPASDVEAAISEAGYTVADRSA